MKSNIDYFFSWIAPLTLYLKSHCHTQGHLGFCLCYFPGLLQFCILYIQVSDPFELIFVKGIGFVSRFIFLHVDVQLFQHYLLKNLSLLFFQRSVESIYESVTGLSVSLICLFCLSPILHCIDYCRCRVRLEVEQFQQS